MQNPEHDRRVLWSPAQSASAHPTALAHQVESLIRLLDGVGVDCEVWVVIAMVGEAKCFCALEIPEQMSHLLNVLLARVGCIAA